MVKMLAILMVAAAMLVLSPAAAKPQVLVDYSYGYYAAPAAYVAGYSAPLAYAAYPYAYTYGYPYTYI